jgi:hypothetical protein
MPVRALRLGVVHARDCHGGVLAASGGTRCGGRVSCGECRDREPSQAAALPDANGSATDTSKILINSTLPDADDEVNKALAAAGVIEAATLVFVASGFALFFPTIIVMFRRVERKMQGLIMEMDNRTDVGNAFLPVEFLPCEADGSMTQEEMPIVEVRRNLRDIEAAAATAQRYHACMHVTSPASAVIQARTLTTTGNQSSSSIHLRQKHCRI